MTLRCCGRRPCPQAGALPGAALAGGRLVAAGTAACWAAVVALRPDWPTHLRRRVVGRDADPWPRSGNRGQF